MADPSLYMRAMNSQLHSLEKADALDTSTTLLLTWMKDNEDTSIVESLHSSMCVRSEALKKQLDADSKHFNGCEFEACSEQ